MRCSVEAGRNTCSVSSAERIVTGSA